MARHVSLLRELATIDNALDSARLVSEALLLDLLPTADDRRRAPGLVTGVLRLAMARLSLLGSAIDGSLDPRHLWSHWNDARLPSDDPEDQDIVLNEWQPQEAIEFYTVALARAQRQLRRKQAGSHDDS